MKSTPEIWLIGGPFSRLACPMPDLVLRPGDGRAIPGRTLTGEATKQKAQEVLLNELLVFRLIYRLQSNIPRN